MSETPESPAPNNPENKKASPLSTILRVVLLAVLVIMVGLLIYDWYVARPGAEAAHQTLAKLDETNNAGEKNSRFTRDEVHKELGLSNYTETTEGNKLYERYTWRRGSLYNTYYVVVIYQKDNDDEGKYRYLRHSYNEEPDAIFERPENAVTDDSSQDDSGDDVEEDMSEFPDQGEGDADSTNTDGNADSTNGDGDPPADDSAETTDSDGS